MPMSLLKTRFESSIYKYSSVSEAIIHIYKNEGITALFRGYSAQFLRDAPQNGLFLVIYKQLQKSFGESYWQSGCYAFIGSFLSCGLTQPFDVIRTHMQLYPEFKIKTIIVNLFAKHRFFDGFLARVFRRSLSSGLTWGIFEFLLSHF